MVLAMKEREGSSRGVASSTAPPRHLHGDHGGDGIGWQQQRRLEQLLERPGSEWGSLTAW